MKIRDAISSDYNSIFMMGFDAWGKGMSMNDYLDACHESVKYKKGQWKVLEDHGTLLSSLIVYSLSKDWFGIGSIATSKKYRRQNWGSKITGEVSEQLEEKSKALFLFADIKPEFYEKLGYIVLPSEHQRYSFSTCMVRAKEKIWNELGFKAPNYF